MGESNAAKRSLSAELIEGVKAMREHREGKMDFHVHRVAAGKIDALPRAKCISRPEEKSA
jgi:hypothetical protein